MKTFLVPFFDDAAAQVALDNAAMLAERFAAHIEGLFVVRPPQVIDGEGMAMMASYVTQLEEEGERLAERARGRFEASMQSRGISPGAMAGDSGQVSASWREFEGLEGQVLGDYGRLFDLLVIGRGFGYPWSDWDAMCEAALFECGRPVLITPERGGSSIGEHCVIAWNGSTETARTIGFAERFLVDADRVTVLHVEKGSVPGPTAADLALNLQRRGIDADSREAKLDNRVVGKAILDEAAAIGGDLLLKGAYTQSRLRQMIFGGATSHILGHAELPVLMAH